MKRSEFNARQLAVLREAAKFNGWAVGENGWVRNAREHCPLTAKSGRFVGSWKDCARAHGLTLREGRQIVGAADLPRSPRRPALLKALRVTPEEG